MSGCAAAGDEVPGALEHRVGRFLVGRGQRDVERDHYMTADEALSYGIVDKIVEARR